MAKGSHKTDMASSHPILINTSLYDILAILRDVLCTSLLHAHAHDCAQAD